MKKLQFFCGLIVLSGCASTDDTAAKRLGQVCGSPVAGMTAEQRERIEHCRESNRAAIYQQIYAEDASRRAAATQYFMSRPRPSHTLQPYQAPAPSRSTDTDCYSIGNRLHCTTR